MLVDTSVWVSLLRNRDTAACQRLRQVLLEDEAIVCPAIVQELLQGARSPKAFRELERRFSRLPMLMPTLETPVQAADLYARCRWQGVTIRSSHDCLIAPLAIEYDQMVLHEDRDFLHIARVAPALRLWAPALGSSDKSHPWLYQSALRRKRGLRLATKSIAWRDRFCRHIPVPGEGLNFSDLPL